jgi:hypothetical protein
MRQKERMHSGRNGRRNQSGELKWKCEEVRKTSKVQKGKEGRAKAPRNRINGQIKE